jgi:4-hydroxy-3-methylbut-2-enyl diphosphate reductase
VEIKLAKAMGTCFGVRDAVNAALDHNEQQDLTIAGQLVHNPQTVHKLRSQGIQMLDNIDAIDQIQTKKVMITAHGASERIKQSLRDRGLEVEDATCPLVERVHRTIKNMVQKGLFPVVIGQRNHVEVKGIVGDLDEYYIVHTEADLEGLEHLGKKKLGIVSQTTNQCETVEKLVEKIKQLPNVESVEFVNTVCKPTRDRQKAAHELANEVDLMIVVGGYNSSNTKKLLKVCEEKNVQGYHIESANELNSAWFKDKNKVGITAGTSTPEDVIQEVYARIQDIAKEHL